jgi:LysR family transcriptional regulator, pca operon transcriptional activator
MELDRRHLTHLAAVALHANVTRAAEALGITQPALSRSVQEIERLLGLRLFDRLPQGMIPTSACRAVLERAQGVLAGFEDLEREAQRFGERFAGELTVGLGPAVAGGSAVAEVGRLLARHPGLRGRLVISSAVELVRRLQALEIDFFVGEQTPVEGDAESLVLEPIEYDAVLLCRAGHPILAAAEPLREVTRYPVALMGPPPAGITSLRELLREGRPNLPADWLPNLVLDHPAALRTLLLEEDFLGGSAAYAHADDLRSGSLRVVPLPRPVHRGRVGPVRLRDRSLPPAGEALWKAISDALRRDLAAARDREADWS